MLRWALITTVWATAVGFQGLPTLPLRDGKPIQPTSASRASALWRGAGRLQMRGSTPEPEEGKPPMGQWPRRLGSMPSGRIGSSRMGSVGRPLQRVQDPSPELLAARAADVADEIKDLEDSMLQTLKRRRKLMLMQQLREEPVEKEAAHFVGNISTFCTCEEYNMPLAFQQLRAWSDGRAAFLDGGEVIHVRRTAEAGGEGEGWGGAAGQGRYEGDVFLFSYGVMVTWGVPEAHVAELLELAPLFNLGDIYDERDSFSYTFGSEFAYIPATDVLVLKTAHNGSDETLRVSTLEKQAASHAFAISAKLASFADGVQDYIMETRDLAAELARDGEIKSKKMVEINKNLGQLVLDRQTMYSYTDVQGSPDVCWEHPELDPLYKTVAQSLDIEPRTELLNKRVEVVKELLSLLSDELKNENLATLEEIIVYLIVIQIFFALYHDIWPLFRQWVYWTMEAGP